MPATVACPSWVRRPTTQPRATWTRTSRAVPGSTCITVAMSLVARIFLQNSMTKIFDPSIAAMASLMILTGIAFLTGTVSEFSYWLLDTFPALGKIGNNPRLLNVFAGGAVVPLRVILSPGGFGLMPEQIGVWIRRADRVQRPRAHI